MPKKGRRGPFDSLVLLLDRARFLLDARGARDAHGHRLACPVPAECPLCCTHGCEVLAWFSSGPCCHLICSTCALTWARSELQCAQASKFPLRCPGSPVCAGHVESVDRLSARGLASRRARLGIRGLLVLRQACAAATATPLLSDAEIQLYDRLCVMAAVPDTERITCPIPGCHAINIVAPTLGRFVECSVCQGTFCTACNCQHPGLTCEQSRNRRRQQQHRQAREEKASAETVALTSKPCPWCSTLITHYKHHGCHHIKPGGGCPGCHNHFCYLCGARSSVQGRWEKPCECPTFCQLGCTCPTCPDCSPGRPCPQCDDPARCPACNPQAAMREARVAAAAAAAAAEAAAAAAAHTAQVVATRLMDSAWEGVKSTAATILLGFGAVFLAAVVVHILPLAQHGH